MFDEDDVTLRFTTPTIVLGCEFATRGAVAKRHPPLLAVREPMGYVAGVASSHRLRWSGQQLWRLINNGRILKAGWAIASAGGPGRRGATRQLTRPSGCNDGAAKSESKKFLEKMLMRDDSHLQHTVASETASQLKVRWPDGLTSLNAQNTDESLHTLANREQIVSTGTSNARTP